MTMWLMLLYLTLFSPISYFNCRCEENADFHFTFHWQQFPFQPTCLPISEKVCSPFFDFCVDTVSVGACLLFVFLFSHGGYCCVWCFYLFLAKLGMFRGTEHFFSHARNGCRDVSWSVHHLIPAKLTTLPSTSATNTFIITNIPTSLT